MRQDSVESEAKARAAEQARREQEAAAARAAKEAQEAEQARKRASIKAEETKRAEAAKEEARKREIEAVRVAEQKRQQQEAIALEQARQAEIARQAEARRAEEARAAQKPKVTLFMVILVSLRWLQIDPMKVYYKGALQRKKLVEAGGKKATDRSWKTFFTVVQGKNFVLYKSEKDFITPVCVHAVECNVVMSAYDRWLEPGRLRRLRSHQAARLLRTTTRRSRLCSVCTAALARSTSFKRATQLI